MKLTDSQIALHWINSTSNSTRSELKLWVRVIEINRLTYLNTWRYVHSNDVMADLGTRKGARVKDITQTSEWVNGKEWMNRCESEFPVSTVSQITLSEAEKSAVSSECNNPDITDQIYTINSYGYERPCSPARIVPGEVNFRYKFSQYLIDPHRFKTAENHPDNRACVFVYQEELRSDREIWQAIKPLVFYVTGLTSKLKFELGYLATKGILSYQVMCTFWQAVMILENICNLCVIAVVSDGASCNRSFIKLHRPMSKADADVVYRTVKLYRPSRHICFLQTLPT